MNWLLRLSLGLPARPSDLEEMQRVVPELLDKDWQGNIDRTRLLLPLVLIHRTGHVVDARELADAIRAWVREVPGRDVPRGPSAAGPCEHPECPRRPSVVQAASDHGSTDDRDSEQPALTHLMVVGGGPGKKPLRDRFLDLVRKVHSGAGAAVKVVVTDPFLLTDTSENGTSGGFKNFCDYLRELHLASNAVLFITPGPKKPSANRTRWIDSVQKAFPGLRIESFASKFSFHDRFYIVEHQGGDVRGVFGPSMNGLSDTDIALFGELEVPNALATLATWFDLKTPSTKAKKTRPRR